MAKKPIKFALKGEGSNDLATTANLGGVLLPPRQFPNYESIDDAKKAN